MKKIITYILIIFLCLNNFNIVKAQENIILEKPKLLNIYNSSNGADIRFKEVIDADAYTIMRKYNGVWSDLKTINANLFTRINNDTLQYIDETIKYEYGKGYIYSIKAHKGQEESAYDTKGLAIYRLKQPTINSAIFKDNNSAIVSWNIEDCHGYELQYSTDGKTWKQIKIIDDNKINYQEVNNLIPNILYVFRIRTKKINKDRGIMWSEYSKWRTIEEKNITLNGIDISNHQKDIDLSKISCDFIIMKATEGWSFKDPSFDYFYGKALALGKKTGFYHYARPVAGIEEAKKEARWFYQNTKQYFRIGIPVLDWEDDNYWDTTWAKAWLDEIYHLSGIKPLIYMNQSTANDYDWRNVVSAGYQIWVAKYRDRIIDYNYDMSNAGSLPNLKYWDNYIMWQWTDRGRLNGYNYNLDLNKFYGNESTWNKIVYNDYAQISISMEVPKLLSIYNSSKGADIHFKGVKDSDAYIIMRKYNNIWTNIKEIKTSDLEGDINNYRYLDETIKDEYGKGYIYAVAAKKGNYKSQFDTLGLGLYRLKAPQLLSIKQTSNNSALINWAKEECHGYELQYSRDGTTWYKIEQFKDPNHIKENIIGLKKGLYYFRIRCQKTNTNRGTTWSNYSSWLEIIIE